jgi:hypothetical protein
MKTFDQLFRITFSFSLAIQWTIHCPNTLSSKKPAHSHCVQNNGRVLKYQIRKPLPTSWVCPCPFSVCVSSGPAFSHLNVQRRSISFHLKSVIPRPQSAAPRPHSPGLLPPIRPSPQPCCCDAIVESFRSEWFAECAFLAQPIFQSRPFPIPNVI